MEALFWLFIAIVGYTYVGYGLLLLLLVRLKNDQTRELSSEEEELPEVTLVVAAWNEEEVIQSKIENTLNLDYPKEKLHFLVVTDGSDDETVHIVQQYSDVTVLHKNERKGKTAALNRAMNFVHTPIVIFSDANAMLNQSAFRRLVRHYADPSVGCVAGEKRIALVEDIHGVGFGEGVYWKYESLLKKNDAKLHSCIGAAGELFSIRTSLFEELPEDTILDDFMISLRIAMRGFRIAYEPDAYAVEYGSQTVGEEIKRKIRISAGGLQAVTRLPSLLNPFRYGLLSIQYLSHRVMRWTLAPIALLILFPLAAYLMVSAQQPIYRIFFWAQLVFYGFAFIGYWMDRWNQKISIFYVPFYFLVMNYCLIRGFFRLVMGRQSSVWERSARTTF